MFRLVVTAHALLLIVLLASAELLRVPEQFPAIQAALDASADRDTISVRIGFYAEALTAPPHFVYLIGDTNRIDDSLHRPEVNPSALPGSINLACLTLPIGSAISVSGFSFVNGPEMFPRNDSVGGIKYYTFDSIIVRDCLFDSVYHGIFRGTPSARPRFLIERCEFHDMTYSSINARGPAVIRDCLVHGQSVSGFSVLDSSLIENCRFTGTIQNSMCGAFRNDNVIRNNSFGPGTHGMEAMSIYSRGGNDSILNNVFNCTSTAWKLMLVVSEGLPVVCQGNTFADSSANASLIAITTSEDDLATEEVHLRFLENRMMGGNSDGQSVKGIHVRSIVSQVEIRGNQFDEVGGQGAVIRVDSNAFHHVIQENFFEGTAYAIENNSSYELDARRNWYGDSTGPHHALLNLQGLGDSLSSHHPIDFMPWLSDSSLWST